MGHVEKGLDHGSWGVGYVGHGAWIMGFGIIRGVGVVGGVGEVVECVMVVGDDVFVEYLEEESIGLDNA